MQTEKCCGIQPLTDEELEKIVKDEATDLDSDHGIKYMLDILTSAGKKGVVPIQNMLFICRCAHLAGFHRALTLYNDAVRDELQEISEQAAAGQKKGD